MKSANSLPEFYSALLEFLMTSKHNLADLAKDYDLTAMQAVTLTLTSLDKPKPMNAFQKLYNCDASNITGIVDGLEEKGYVVRGEKSDDRRVKIVLLTPQGAKTKEKIIRTLIHSDNSTLNKLSEEELSQFRTIITKLSSKTFA